jgi:hypothetical protein
MHPVNDTPDARSAPEGTPSGPIDGPTLPGFPNNLWLGPLEADDSNWVWNFEPWDDEGLAEYVRADTVAALLATRDRYEAALREIARCHEYQPHRVQEIVRKALAADQEETNG